MSFGAFILSAKESNYYFGYLSKEIPWEHDEVIIFGERILTRRMVAQYGDRTYLYTYSNCTKQTLPWTAELWNLKEKISTLVGTKFNTCLLNCTMMVMWVLGGIVIMKKV